MSASPPVSDHVLSLAVEATECWVARGITEAMNRFNRRAGDDAAAAKQAKAADTSKSSAPGKAPGKNAGETPGLNN